jgi:GDP-D-mannose 3', 5'-epimerase
LIGEKLGWKPSATLRAGLEKSYEWIERQVRGNNRVAA